MAAIDCWQRRSSRFFSLCMLRRRWTGPRRRACGGDFTWWDRATRFTATLRSSRTGNIRSIYDNGVILANAPDENAAEEAVHYALLEHPAPRRVLLIGGGVNGSIAQALKHPTVERIDYVELDPALIDMARQFFPAQSAPVALGSSRAHALRGRPVLSQNALATHST